MKIKLVKSLFFLLCLITNIVFACSMEELNDAFAQVKLKDKLLNECRYNYVFLESQKQYLEHVNEKVDKCLNDSFIEFKKIEAIEKNIKRINPNPEYINKYHRKMQDIIQKQNFASKIANEVERLLLNIDRDIRLSKKISNESHEIKKIPDLIKHYQPSEKQIILKPGDEIFPYLFLLKTEKKFLFYFLIFTSFGCGIFGLYVFKKIKENLPNIKYQNMSLFLNYLKWVLPLLFFILPLELSAYYATKNWLLQPNILKFYDFIWRIIASYILALIAICFMLDNKFDKNELISLLIKTGIFLFLGIFLQTSYLVFFEQTDLTLLIYLLLYIPIYYCLFLYFGYRWSFINILSDNIKKCIFYRVSCLLFISIYIIVRLKNIYSGYIFFTSIQFILLMIILFFYYKFIQFQIYDNLFISLKNHNLIQKNKTKFFNKDETLIYELKILLVVGNIYLLIFLMMLIFNLMDVSIETSYQFYKLIYLPLNINYFNITLIKIVYALSFFAILMLIERYFALYLLTKRRNKKNLNIFLTKKNFIHYLMIVVGVVIALIILGFPSSYLVLIFGGLGFGAGFGLQFIIENLISGLLIILENEFLVGDDITILNLDTGGVILEGKIQHIHSLETTIINNQNIVVFIPNSTLLKNGVKKELATNV